MEKKLNIAGRPIAQSHKKVRATAKLDVQNILHKSMGLVIKTECSVEPIVTTTINFEQKCRVRQSIIQMFCTLLQDFCRTLLQGFVQNCQIIKHVM